MKLNEFKAISYQINNYSLDPFIEKVSEKFGYDEWYKTQIRARIYNNTMGFMCNHDSGDYLFELIWEAAQKNYPDLIDDSGKVEGTAYTHDEWLERAIRGVKPRGVQDTVPVDECPRWVAVMEHFSCGSTYAANLCRAYGFDPDEKVHDRRFKTEETND